MSLVKSDKAFERGVNKRREEKQKIGLY